MSENLNPQVPRINQIESTQPVGSSQESTGTGRSFSSYMEQQTPSSTNTSSSVSPMDLARSNVSTGAPTIESVNSQMNAASSALGDLQNKLNTPNLKLKPSQKYLLRNKLQEANQQIRQVAEKSGVDVGSPVNTLSRNNPLGKFLSLISDGEIKLNQAQTSLASLKAPLSPAELLMMQFKLSRAQQEIEYSSVLLSKAVDDIKTIFNIQI